MPRDAIDLIEITEHEIETPNSILALFNPTIPFSQEKRKPGRPRKVQPALPEGHMKHAMSDDDGLAERKSASFPLLEQHRFQQEYQYELTIMKRSPKPVLLELAALYGIDYTMAHDCVKDLPLL